MPGLPTIETQLTIIGAGIAGLASAVFAAGRGIETVLVGGSGGAGASDFSSGYLDLLGSLPGEARSIRSDPWQGLVELCEMRPHHPYALAGRRDIAAAFEELLRSLEKADLPHTGEEASNSEAITPAGLTKPTYRMPRSMWAGKMALAEKAPCLLLDFHGLKDFSAAMVRAGLQKRWPELRSARVPFPDSGARSELFTGLMAMSLESEAAREKLVHSVRPLLGQDEYVGFPAVLGLYRTREIAAELEERLEASVFEIPTLPPSVPGQRFKEACDRLLSGSTVRRLSNQRAKLQEKSPDRFLLKLEHGDRATRLASRAVILASGRFLGRGLTADRKRIREPIFGLPVHQPEQRDGWHCSDFFDPRGHPVNLSGLEVDHAFRPVAPSGDPVHGHLFACGSILAHQDWIKTKSGAGISLASAYKAVTSSARLLEAVPSGHGE
jgi:glycerol-3-phosphate dehydrogenase subunit B